MHNRAAIVRRNREALTQNNRDDGAHFFLFLAGTGIADIRMKIQRLIAMRRACFRLLLREKAISPVSSRKQGPWAITNVATPGLALPASLAYIGPR